MKKLVSLVLVLVLLSTILVGCTKPATPATPETPVTEAPNTQQHQQQKVKLQKLV